MKLSISVFEHLDKLKVLASKKLGLSSGLRLDFALDGIHAVNDVVRGLLDLHPHKRSIAVLGAQPQPLDGVIKNLAKQGYSVQELPVDFLKPEVELKTALIAALETLKKDTLFVLTAAMEPFTGIFYPVGLIRDELAKKNIFLIQYLNPESLKAGFKFPTSGLEAFIYDPFWGQRISNALIIKGERCAGEKLFWGESPYNLENIDALCAALKKSAVKLNKKKILDFEKKTSSSFKEKIKVLPTDLNRLFDRSVFFVKGMNGDALVHKLKKQKVSAFTPDSCYWQDPHLNTWLPKLGFSVEDSQTCIVLEPTPKLSKTLKLF